MSAEPITREQLRARAEILRARDLPPRERAVNDAVLALLDHADALALRRRVQNALATLGGHTCHEGFTRDDEIALYRRFVAEIQTALDLTRPAP